MTSKKNPQDRFREFAAGMPALPTSLMATAHAPTTSKAARQAARFMVGDLSSDEGRIVRIASSLDRLVELNQRQTSSGKQRRGSNK